MLLKNYIYQGSSGITCNYIYLGGSGITFTIEFWKRLNWLIYKIFQFNLLTYLSKGPWEYLNTYCRSAENCFHCSWSLKKPPSAFKYSANFIHVVHWAIVTIYILYIVHKAFKPFKHYLVCVKYGNHLCDTAALSTRSQIVQF